MPKRNRNKQESDIKLDPCLTQEARESRIISEAYDLVERRIINGTASSQEVTHFLKLGSEIAKLEKEKLKRENDLLVAKKEAYQSAKNVEELYSKAIHAMKEYSGGTPNEN